MSRKVGSGPGTEDVQDVGSTWQGHVPSQRDGGSGGHGSHVGVILGAAGACEMKQWEIP